MNAYIFFLSLFLKRVIQSSRAFQSNFFNSLIDLLLIETYMKIESEICQ